MTPDIATIAAGLSEAQRRMARYAAPKRCIDGVLADFTIFGRGVVKHALMRRGLSDGVRLTSLGERVRAYLQEQAK